MTKKMDRYVQFACFCKNHDLNPSDVADLITLSNRIHLAYVRGDSERDMDDYNRAQEKFEIKARSLGFGTTYSGIGPTLNRDGYDIHLPRLD